MPMSARFVIRPYRPADAVRLHEIRAAAFAPIFASFRALVGERIAPAAFAGAEAEQERQLDAFCAAAPPDGVLVACAGHPDGPTAGFAAFTIDPATAVGELELNAVDPAYQRQGAGRALYAAAFDRMRAAGMRVATVGTGADPSHAPARAAYAQAGFLVGVPSVYLYKEL